MKARQSGRQTAKISHSRWLVYATASAATTLAGSNSMEAAIHYSGYLGVEFRGDEDGATFQLDQPGDFFRFRHVGNNPGVARFSIFGIASTAGFRGFFAVSSYRVSKLSFGRLISTGRFTSPTAYPGIMASDYNGAWTDPGGGFVGFRFNNGAGVQYGWARVRMFGSPSNAFKLQDYAYADPGEPIRAGQKCRRSSDEQAPDQGSLGGLALGALGLLAWRKSRSLTAR